MLYGTLSRARPSLQMRGMVNRPMTSLLLLVPLPIIQDCPRRPGPSLLIIRRTLTQQWAARGPGRARDGAPRAPLYQRRGGPARVLGQDRARARKAAGRRRGRRLQGTSRDPQPRRATTRKLTGNVYESKPRPTPRPRGPVHNSTPSTRLAPFGSASSAACSRVGFRTGAGGRRGPREAGHGRGEASKGARVPGIARGVRGGDRRCHC